MPDALDWTALALVLALLALRVHPRTRGWAPRGLLRPPTPPVTGTPRGDRAPRPGTAVRATARGGEHRLSPAGSP